MASLRVVDQDITVRTLNITPPTALTTSDVVPDAAHVDVGKTGNNEVLDPMITSPSIEATTIPSDAVALSHSHSGAAAVPDLQDLAQAEKSSKLRKRANATTKGAPNPKKRKTDTGSAGSVASSIALDAPDGSPEWVIKALTLLRATALGSEWEKLIDTWLEFEGQSSFTGSDYLTANSRPRAITDWIQRARAPNYRPVIKSVSKFAESFAAWWSTMQPSWRVANSRDELSGDWEKIRRPGVNGLLSVMAALFFWGDAMKNTEAASNNEQATWLKALNDVMYVLESLI